MNARTKYSQTNGYDEKINIARIPKIIGLPYDTKTLMTILQQNKVFERGRFRPRQKYIDKGYFVLEERLFEPNNHNSFTINRIYVTERGLSFLTRLFCQPLPKSQTKCE